MMHGAWCGWSCVTGTQGEEADSTAGLPCVCTAYVAARVLGSACGGVWGFVPGRWLPVTVWEWVNNLQATVCAGKVSRCGLVCRVRVDFVVCRARLLRL